MTGQPSAEEYKRPGWFFFWSVPAWFSLLLFVAWSVVVCWRYFDLSPLNWRDLPWIFGQWFDRVRVHSYTGKALLSLVLAGWVAWLSIQIGRRALSRFAASREMTALERMIFGAGLGLGVLSYLSVLLGFVHLWYVGVFWALLLLLTLVPWLWPLTVSDRVPWAMLVKRGGPFSLLLVLCFSIFLVSELTPEISYDALYYHLAVPNLYRLAHQMVAVPTMIFSNFIMTVQTLYGLALTIGNELVAKLLHGFMGLTLLLAFLAFGQRYLSPGAGMIGGAIFFSIPIVGFNLSTAGIDVGWTLFQFLAGFALFRGLECAYASDQRRSWTVVTGVFMGLAMSCRYLGWLALPPVCAVIFAHRVLKERRSFADAAREAAWVAGVAMVVAVPWLARNLFSHGNPIYPLGGMSFGWPRISLEQWTAFAQDTHARLLTGTADSWIEFGRFVVRHPWDLTMHGSSSNDFVGPLVLCLLPLLVLSRVTRYPLPQVRVYFLLLWTVWLFTNTIPRYGLPALAVLSLLLAEAMVALSVSRWQRRLLSLGVVALACTNLYWQVLDLHVSGGWRVLNGEVQEEEYLKNGQGSSYRTPPYAALSWMNRNLDPRAKVLFIGEARSHYLDRLSIPSSVLDPQPLVQWSNEAENAQALWRRLKAEGTTHLFLNYGQALVLEEFQLFRWTPHGWATFQEFWNRYIRLLWFEELALSSDPRLLYVYQLLDEPEADRSHSPPVNPFLHWAPGPPG